MVYQAVNRWIDTLIFTSKGKRIVRTGRPRAGLAAVRSAGGQPARRIARGPPVGRSA